MAKITVPRHLKGKARKWFAEMLAAYVGFEDEPNSVSILVAAAEQLRRCEQYRESIEQCGLMIDDRFGQPKENPAAVGERSAANLHRLLCRDLGLEPAVDEKIRLPRIAARAG